MCENRNDIEHIYVKETYRSYGAAANYISYYYYQYINPMDWLIYYFTLV